jgi:hypothetical protein
MKRTTDDYLSFVFFGVLACVFIMIAHWMNKYDDMGVYALISVILAFVSVLLALWSLSDFKTWK